jgi:aminoglycoside phosphotransferase (APT) family kinase protein
METVISQEQIQQLLQHTFGTKVEIIDCQVGNRQPNYLVLLLQLRQPSIAVVVKLAGPDAAMACSFDRTAMLHRLVATQTTIPMPEVLAVNMSYQDWPWRYFIRTHIPGQELALVRGRMNRNELLAAYQQIGSAVAQLHAIHFPMFGELAADGSVQGHESYFPAFTQRARHSIQSARLLDMFLSLIEKQKHLFLDVRQASLCHEDLHGYNLLFQYRQGQWRLATILDFDKAWAGHHEIDLARLDFWRGMLSEAFWRAYDTGRAIQPRYQERRPIYQLLWCLEYARPTTEHLADTQHLCAELGLPRIERFD